MESSSSCLRQAWGGKITAQTLPFPSPIALARRHPHDSNGCVQALARSHPAIPSLPSAVNKHALHSGACMPWHKASQGRNKGKKVSPLRPRVMSSGRCRRREPLWKSEACNRHNGKRQQKDSAFYRLVYAGIKMPGCQTLRFTPHHAMLPRKCACRCVDCVPVRAGS